MPEEIKEEPKTEKKKKAGTESSKESSLKDWFGRKGAKGKQGGWVDCNTCRKDKKTGRKKCKPCGRKEGEQRSKYPACRPTPGACEEKGRSKSWGKKSAKKYDVASPSTLNGIAKITSSTPCSLFFKLSIFKSSTPIPSRGEINPPKT